MSDLKISISIDAKETKTGANEAKREIRGIGDEAKRTAGTYVDSSGQMRDANGRFVKSTDDARRSVTSLAKVDFSAAIRQIKEYGDTIKTIGSQIADVGQSLSIKLTAPILALALLIAGLGTTYESALNTFQAVTKATSDEMRQASQVAKDLGADVTLPATSAKDAALAMAELGKAGFTAAQAMSAAKGVLQLAAAGQLEEAKAAEIAANAINSFSLKAEDAVRVADLLAAASNASSAEVTDVAESFSQASASFAAAKVPIEDLTTAIAIMANAGIKGSDAGTSLKTFLSSLQAPSDSGADALKNLGIKVFDLQGRMKSLPDIIGQFDKSLAGLTDEKKVQAIQAIFGADASRAAQILFRDGEAGFQKIKEAVTLTGSAADLAAAKTKGVGGAFESLKSQAETIGITIYDALKGPAEQGLRLLADNLGKVSDYLSNLGQNNPEIIQMAAVFLAVVAAVGPLLVIIGTLITFLGSVVTSAGTLIGVFATVGSAFLGVGGFIVSFIGLIGEAGLIASFTALATVTGSTVVAAIGSFLTALAPIAVGAAAVAVVIGGLIAVGVALYAAWQTNFGGLRDFTDEVFDGVQQAISTALGYVQQLWATYGDRIIETATTTFNNIIEFIRPIMAEIVGTVREGFRTIVEVAGPLLTQVYNHIKILLTGAAVVVRAALAGISQLWQQNGEQIKNIVFAVWTILKTIVIEGIRQIASVITLVMAILNSDWKAAWTAFKTIIFSAVNATTTIFKSLGTIILNALKLVATAVFGIGKNIVDGLINGIKSGASSLYNAAADVAKVGLDAIRGVFRTQSPSRETMEIGQFVTEGLAIGISNKADLAVNAAKRVSSAVVKAFKDAQKEFGKLAGASPQTVKTIQDTNRTSDAASAQQEIIKLRGELGVNTNQRLPRTVAATEDELRQLQELKKNQDEYNESVAAANDLIVEQAVAYRLKLEDMRDAGVQENLRLREEIELVGVTDETERRRIQNYYEILSLRDQMASDGYSQNQIDEAVQVLQIEQARKGELLQILEIRKQVAGAKDLGESLTGDLTKLQNGNRELSVYEQTLKKIEKDYKDISPVQREAILNTAKQIDAQKAYNEQYKQTYDFIRGAFDILTDSSKSFGDKMKSIFGGIFQSFKKMLLDMVSAYLTSKLLKILNPNSSPSGDSSGGGLFSNLLGGIKNLFNRGGSSSSGSTNTNGLLSTTPGAIGNSFVDSTGKVQTVGGGSGIGLAGGIAIAGTAANIIGGLIGGRAGGFLSNIGSGAAIGAQIDSIVPGIGALIGAGVGAVGGFLASLFGGDPKRKRDKNEKLPQLNKSFTDALAQLRALGADKNAFYNDPESVIAKAVELRGQIASGFGVQFESKKYQKEAQSLIAQKLTEADSIISDLERLKNRALRARDVDSRLQTSFATGVYLRDDQMSEMKRALDFKRRNGMLAGNFTGIDTLPSMLAKGEMVLNPMQIQQVILNAGGDDPFRNADIPGYVSGGYIAPSPSSAAPVSAPVSSSNAAPNTIKIDKISIVVEKDESGNLSFKELLVDNLKKPDVRVELVEAYDKTKARTR